MVIVEIKVNLKTLTLITQKVSQTWSMLMVKYQYLIIDDMMRKADAHVVYLFSVVCIHRNISVFFITQNLFHQEHFHQDILFIAHYIVWFMNPRDRDRYQVLGRTNIHRQSKILRGSVLVSKEISTWIPTIRFETVLTRGYANTKLHIFI